MNKNVGGIDKLLRILVSMAIMAVGFYNPEYWWTFVVGVILLLTAIFALCPLYSVLGISTCRTDSCDN